jgi:ABC-type transport system involved in cytochrome c biogenesis permease subunit
MNNTSRTIAWCFATVVGVSMGGYLLMSAMGRPDDPKDFPLQEFGQLPVQDHGRVKPIDTLARVNLMIISGKQEYTDEAGNTQPAIRWLLDLMTASQRQKAGEEGEITGNSGKIKAYRIEDLDLRKKLKLDGRPEGLLSYEDILRAAGPEGLGNFFKEASELTHPDQGQLNARDQAMADLYYQLRGHLRFSSFETPHRVFRIDNFQVLALLGLEGRSGYRYGFDEILPRLSELEREARRALKVNQKNPPVYEAQLIEVFNHVELYLALAVGNAKTLSLVVPNHKGDEWHVLPDALVEARKAMQEKDQAALEGLASTAYFQGILNSYARNNKERFKEALVEYTKKTREVIPTEAKTAATESSFNAFAPFFCCAWLYVVVFVVACVSWLWRDPVINRFAFWSLLLIFAVHTWALIARMWIQGRPPVTNLYSSAVFIGWVCVLLCAVIEWKYRNALASAVAGLTGFATLFIAHYLGGSGDTLEMMQAVLDTNFWLATHVTSVTIGYAATFVAGLFGLLYLWMMLVTTVLNSLRQGGKFSVGQAVLFGIASLGVTLFVMTLYSGILMGLWYLAHRDAAVGAVVGVLSVALLTAAVAYAVYLTVQRVQIAKLPQAPARLPHGTRTLEYFALTESSRQALKWMLYGTVCFAMLFSFLGTVLGGIWADQSWGRFWGWDPKENGALLIVIMNAMILHARWGGMIQERGMAVLALLGNMVTMWSWFGTNQLGIGLHAYGFNNALVLLCRWFWVSQLLLIGVALLPYTNWRTYTPLPVEESQPGREKGEKASTRVRGKRGGPGIQPA